MNCICVQCYKHFDSRRPLASFCSPECHAAFKREEDVWKKNQRQCLHEGINHIPGSVPCRGGYQARNRGLSDGSDLT